MGFVAPKLGGAIKALLLPHLQKVVKKIEVHDSIPLQFGFLLSGRVLGPSPIRAEFSCGFCRIDHMNIFYELLDVYFMRKIYPTVHIFIKNKDQQKSSIHTSYFNFAPIKMGYMKSTSAPTEIGKRSY